MSDIEGSDHNDIDNSKSEIHRRLTSTVWNTFTVVDRKNHIAVCKICDKRLSFKTTVTNLKKHVVRKHPGAGARFSSETAVRREITEISYKREHRENKPFDVRRGRLTDLGGLEGLVLNVIGDDGETETLVAEHEANQDEIYTEEVHHDFCPEENNQGEKSPSKEHRASKPQQTTNIDPSERRKRSRIMDLQLECLEIKKYNMQLEALMLEQQLNIRRSIFTEPLQCSDVMTRGTQTEVGGENTRVFYLADGKGGVPIRHLFAMQELD